MIHRSFAPYSGVPLILFAVALALSACATGPRTAAPIAPAAPAASAAPAPTRGYGEMAPIPNPNGETARPQRPALPPSGAAPRNARPAPTAAPAPGVNPARAAQLRAAGLEQLNRGAVDRAIALLQQASQLDPSSALIKRDLDRATRIGRAVKGE